MSKLAVGRLVLWPALITLGITLLRLAGELLEWSPRLFNRDAGGGAATDGGGERNIRVDIGGRDPVLHPL